MLHNCRLRTSPPAIRWAGLGGLAGGTEPPGPRAWPYTESVKLSRRSFVGGLAAMPLLAEDEGWIPLFNGKNLDGWKPSEHRDAWKVRDGQIVADGARSHLFYTGRDFKNFELEVEALAETACNSGVYFHTAYQETGFPIKGFEVRSEERRTRRPAFRSKASK